MFFDNELAIDQTVAKRCLAGREFSGFHPPFIAHPHILSDGFTLFLRQGGEDSSQRLAGNHGTVDVLFLEADPHAQGPQLPRGLEEVLRVPGEPGHGLYQNLIDQTPLAVGEEALKVLALVRRRAGDAPVSVDVDQLPVRVLMDQGGVVSVLSGEGVELVLGVRADAAVGRYPELSGFRLFCRRDGDEPRSRVQRQGTLCFPLFCHPRHTSSFASNTLPQNL